MYLVNNHTYEQTKSKNRINIVNTAGVLDVRIAQSVTELSHGGCLSGKLLVRLTSRFWLISKR